MHILSMITNRGAQVAEPRQVESKIRTAHGQPEIEGIIQAERSLGIEMAFEETVQNFEMLGVQVQTYRVPSIGVFLQRAEP